MAENEEEEVDIELSVEKLRALSSFFYSNLARKHPSAVGVKYADLVVDCYYKGRTCTQSDFKHYLHPTLVNCFTFQANLTNTTGQHLDGPYKGLSLILRSTPNINFLYQRLDAMQNTESIRLAIHPPGTVPFMTKNAISLEAGKSTSISLMMKTYERLGSPYAECQDNEVFQLDSQMLKATRDVCAELCMIETIQRECNCTSTLFEDLSRSNHQYCSAVDNVSPSEFIKRSKCEIGLAQGEKDIDCTNCIWDCQYLTFNI